MNEEIRLVDVRKNIFSENDNQAEMIRDYLGSKKIFMVNMMASPGAGKTSLIIQTIRRLGARYRIAVIEGDVETTIDSQKIIAEGVPAVQICTGGACHLDAVMVNAALDQLDLENIDLVFIENIGNLICPAEFDIGADIQVVVLSVPEGDDKIFKYPMMFSISHGLIINKLDYLELSDFDSGRFRQRAAEINPPSRIFEISCKTGTGLDGWCEFLAEKIEGKRAGIGY